MKILPQASPDLVRLGEALEPHHVAMLTLVDADASLSSRPMTPIEMDKSGRLWFMISRRSLLAPLGGPGGGGVAVNLAFALHDSMDYVSVRGLARSVDDAARKQALWSAFSRPWFDGPRDPDLLLLAVEPQRAEIWDGPDSSIGKWLSLAVSIAAGREIGLGHKEELPTPPAED